MFFHLSVFLIALALVGGSSALGQRVIAEVDVSAADPQLRFDVNDSPFHGDKPPARDPQADLDFAPNVVFSPDSTKGFVSLPGAFTEGSEPIHSDKVAVFDPRTGEIVALLQVGNTPAQLTLSPDGRTLAVTCLFALDNRPKQGALLGDQVGAVSLIDVETLEVRTIDFDTVLFSFANNVVFSGDGRTGFVASAGTDEILRFDVVTAEEISPRLKVRDGTRPTSLTISPDFSFFAAVLVGSSALSTREVPDSIQIIDAESFTVRRSIAPEVPADQPPHNFMAVNNVAFTSDGKYGLIADQRNSFFSPFLPALATDRAFLFEVETGEIVSTFALGTGIAGRAFTTPEGRGFVVVSTLALSFIDADEKTVDSLTPASADFAPSTGVTFSPDGRHLLVASPHDDRLVVLDRQTREIVGFPSVGEPVEFNGFFVPSAPMDLTFTPDGEILSILHFNADRIDLAVPTERFFIPRLLSKGEWFTGVALTNNSDLAAEVVSTGISNSGVVFRDDPETEDVVEFVNPQTFTLGPGEQLARTAEEWVEAAPEQTVEGWLNLESDRFDSTAFFMIGDWQGKRLDGGLAARGTAKSEVLPLLRISRDFRVELTVLYPHHNLVNFTFELYDLEGTKRAEIQAPQGPQFSMNRFVRAPPGEEPDPDEDPEPDVMGTLFGEEAFEDFEAGYLVVTSDLGLRTFLRYYDAERMATLNGFPISGPAVELHSRLYIPHVATFGGSQTRISLINTREREESEEEEGEEEGEDEPQDGEKATVTLTLRGNDGRELAPPVMVQLAGRQAIQQGLAELFSLEDPGTPIGGWVLVESDLPGILGAVEIVTFDGRAMTAVPAQAVPTRRIVFSHVAQGLGYSTGLALLNPGDEPASIAIEVFDPDGVRVDQGVLNLAAGERVAQLLGEFLPAFPGLVGGYVRITSDREILGLQLFFTDDLEQLSAVPGQVLPFDP